MINQQAIDTLFETLYSYQEEIKMLSDVIRFTRFADIPDVNSNVIIKVYTKELDNSKSAYCFIQDLLVLEYEHLEIQPILEQLSA